ncbi:MAG: Ku protein [Thermoanaerobaculia bacterium]
MRGLWSGHITFGLVSIPVGLYAALESSEKVAFRLLHRKDMAPINYKKFCSKENIEVSADEIVKGFEVEKSRFAAVEKEELDEIGDSLDDNDRIIDVLQFVEHSSLNPLSFEKPYYLAPQKGGEKAYAVLRDALTEANRVGIVRFTLRTRPQLAALIPGREVLALEVMRTFKELRDPSELSIPASAPRPAEMKMARLLIDQMSTEAWEPASHPNEYREALEKLLSAKKSFVVAKEKEAQGGEEGKVVDLMEALRRSVAGSGSQRSTRQRARSAAQAPARRKAKKTDPKRAGAA